jgi:disulfide bond formation protein DsbB
MAVTAVVLASDCAHAMFHEGLQQGWWTDSSLCEAPLSPASTITSLQMTPADRLIPVPCDDTDWSVLGLSVAMLNFAYSAILTLGCIVFAVMADGEKSSLFDSDPPAQSSRRHS